MVKSFKRLSLALFALGLSAPVFAYCDSPFCVTVPNQQGGFSVGLDALYWRATSPDNSYAFVNGPVQTVTSTTTAQDFTVKGVNPNYNWGFDLNAAYRIPCTGNDLSVEWVHLQQSSDNKGIVAPNAVTSFELGDPVTLIDIPDVNVDTDEGIRTLTADPTSTHWDTAASTQKYRYDHVDLDVGQRVNFGCRFNFHMIAGVRWADIDHQRNSNFLVNSPVRVSTDTIDGVPTVPSLVGTVIGSTKEASAVNDESEFRGFGPQIGFDGRYCIGYGFGFDAGAKASLLVGRTSISRDTLTTQTFSPNAAAVALLFVKTTDVQTATVVSHSDVDNKNRVVPALDINLGLDYTYNFNNCARSSLVVEAGYKVIHYWGASQFVGGVPFANNTTDINHDHSVSFDGPYAGIKVNV